jgi:hypothetical protein
MSSLYKVLDCNDICAQKLLPGKKLYSTEDRISFYRFLYNIATIKIKPLLFRTKFIKIGSDICKLKIIKATFNYLILPFNNK